MSKIKSARDLAMERTAGLEAAGKDTLSAELEQYIKAAGYQAASFLKGEKEADQVLESVSRYPEAVREEAVHTVINDVLSAINLDNCPRVLELLAALRENAAQKSAFQDLREAHRRYQEELARVLAGLEGENRKALLAELKKAGFSGSAIAGVNPRRSAWWQQAKVNLNERFLEETAHLRAQLAAL